MISLVVYTPLERLRWSTKIRNFFKINQFGKLHSPKQNHRQIYSYLANAVACTLCLFSLQFLVATIEAQKLLFCLIYCPLVCDCGVYRLLFEWSMKLKKIFYFFFLFCVGEWKSWFSFFLFYMFIYFLVLFVFIVFNHF